MCVPDTAVSWWIGSPVSLVIGILLALMGFPLLLGGLGLGWAMATQRDER